MCECGDKGQIQGHVEKNWKDQWKILMQYDCIGKGKDNEDLNLKFGRK